MRLLPYIFSQQIYPTECQAWGHNPIILVLRILGQVVDLVFKATLRDTEM